MWATLVGPGMMLTRQRAAMRGGQARNGFAVAPPKSNALMTSLNAFSNAVGLIVRCVGEMQAFPLGFGCLSFRAETG